MWKKRSTSPFSTPSLPLNQNHRAWSPVEKQLGVTGFFSVSSPYIYLPASPSTAFTCGRIRDRGLEEQASPPRLTCLGGRQGVFAWHWREACWIQSCWNIWITCLVLPSWTLSWTDERMSLTCTLTCAAFIFFVHSYSSVTAKKSDTTCLPLALPPFLLLLPQGQPTVCPGGCLSMGGGVWRVEARRGTGLFRFGRQQWTSVSADGLLQHMVPTCLPFSLLSLAFPPPLPSLCLSV